MKHVVVGAGYTGRRVLAQLPAGGASGLSRTAEDIAGLAVAALDLDNPDLGSPERSLFSSGEYRVLYTVPPGPDAVEDHRLGRLLHLLNPVPQRFTYISTSGVYGDCHGELVDESRPANPESPRAIRRYAAEAKLRDWCMANQVELFILRVPGIYGPGRLGLARIRAAEALVAESEAKPGNRIHIDDLVRCCVATLTSDAVPGIYNVGDGDYRSSTWFAMTVARLAGVSPPPQVSYATALQTFSEARLSFLAESRRLDNRKLLDEMGSLINYTNTEDGIRASLTEEV